MAITFPTPAQAAAQTPSNTFSPASTPLANTSNSFTYVYDGARGVWTSFGSIATGGLGTVTSVAAGDGLQTSLPANAPITTTGTISVDANRVTLKTGSAGAAIIPSGAVGDRPGVPVVGYLRWNTTTTVLEVYTPTGWRAVQLAP
jgi:hypothetical protein